jgi:hypothetical protein
MSILDNINPISSIVDGAIKLFRDYYPPDLSEEQKAQLSINEMQIRANLTTLATNSLVNLEQQVTERHKNDMSSDSWLSKNIRPMLMIYLMALFTIFAVASASLTIDTVYVEILKEMLMAAFGFYFAGRTLEKVTGLITSRK